MSELMITYFKYMLHLVVNTAMDLYLGNGSCIQNIVEGFGKRHFENSYTLLNTILYKCTS